MAAAAGLSLLLAIPAVAAAAGRADTCTERLSGRVFVDGSLDGPFRDALEQACSAFLSGDNVDTSIVVHVIARGRDAEVVATLADGRRAVRRIHTPEQLELAMRALIVMPPAESQGDADAFDRSAASNAKDEAQTPAMTKAAGNRTTRKLERPIAEGSRETPPKDELHSRIGFEIGAATNLHLAGSPMFLSPSFGAYAGLVPGSWLFAVVLRWDPIESPIRAYSSSLEMDSAGLGVTLVRRFGGGSARLDAGANATLLAESQSFEADDGEHAGTQTDLRIGLVSRALFGRKNPRWTVNIEANVSPARLRRAVRIDPALPRLPAWELGAGVGATWSEL